jgi:haloalkane dehalogenase
MTAIATPPWVDRTAYPFESKSVTLSVARMHYIDEGSGDPILFVHGTPTWSFEWRHLVSALSATHRCIAPDLLGFGLSDRPSNFSYTPETHAETLRKFVDHLGLDAFTLIVHDFGGPIGLPLALAEGSKVDRIVIINSWMWPLDDDPDMMRKARIAGGALGRWMYRNLNLSLRVLMPSAYGRRSALTKEIHRQYLEVFTDKSARVRVLHALARALIGSRDHYARLLERRDRLQHRATLIVWGMKDRAFTPKLLARWRALLPNAAVVTLPDAGHWPHEESPDAVLHALRPWLAESARLPPPAS